MPLNAQQKYFAAWLPQHHLPQPKVELTFHKTKRWRFDFAWPAQKIALEIEGGVFGGTDPKTGRQYKGAHSSIEGILRDIAKYNAAQIAGWKVLRVLPSESFTQSTIDLLKKALPHE